MSLDRVERVRSRLGITFHAPVITVAGTNGKGSTCAILDSIGRQAGWRVGMYSKPHLRHFEERCRIGGVLVTAAELLPHFEAVEQARGQTTLTYFEHTTLAILRLLSMTELDLVILEVGLGGRLDAVNVIDTDCAVITTIDIDHVEYLGSNREAIGYEKAGIMRSARPVVVGDREVPASVVARCHDWCTAVSGGWRVRSVRAHFRPLDLARLGCTQRVQLPRPALLGQGQIDNAASALAALAALPLPLPLPILEDAVVAEGLRQVRLEGRFQVVQSAPEIILDVAHNLQSVSGLATTLQQRRCGGRTIAVFGCMADKNMAAMTGAIASVMDRWHVTGLPSSPRAARGTDLLEALERSGVRHGISSWNCVEEALNAARSEAGPNDRIVVFGSFVTVGEALHCLKAT